MSRTGRITLFYGDGDHTFRLGVGETEELDELFGLGLSPILQRVMELHVPTIRAVLRIGQTGVGVHRDKAAQLVSRHCVDGYYLESAEAAAKVIQAACKGVPDDMPGESKGEGATTATLSPTDE